MVRAGTAVGDELLKTTGTNERMRWQRSDLRAAAQLHAGQTDGLLAGIDDLEPVSAVGIRRHPFIDS